MATVNFKGNPIQIKGNLPECASIAPNFELVKQDLGTLDLNSLGKQKKLLNIFVSLDTPICSQSIHNFYQDSRGMSNLAILNISMDLPFAASRFCKQENLDKVTTLSAFRSSFPDDYGVRILDGPLKGLSARAVFLLGEDNTVLYRELVPEITQEPDYEAALRHLS